MAVCGSSITERPSTGSTIGRPVSRAPIARSRPFAITCCSPLPIASRRREPPWWPGSTMPPSALPWRGFPMIGCRPPPTRRRRRRADRPTSTIWARAERLRRSFSRRLIVPARVPFDYAVLRVVPRVEREEFLNIGVVLHAPTRAFLGCHVSLDHRRLCLLAPELTPAALAELEAHLAAWRAVCAGTPGA